MIKVRFSAFTLGFFVWSTKLGHENKSFSSPPLNVRFRVAVQQITWYRSRTAYLLLIKGSVKAHWFMTLYGLKKMIYADVFWATKFQPLHSFFVSKIDEHERDEREPVGLVLIKSPAVFILIREIDDLQRENRSTISKEKVECLWTGYENAFYYFSGLFKRSQVTMLTSWKVYSACLSLRQKEEMGGLVGIGFCFRINTTHTKIHVFITTFRASRLCLIHKIGA